MLRAINSSLAAIILLLLGTPAAAQRVDPLRVSFGALAVVPDGSSSPPGDRLQLTAVLHPVGREADSVRLEVRAYRIEGSDDELPRRTRVSVANRRLQDSWVLVDEAIDLPTVPVLRHEMTIPYAVLDLAPGTHRVGYEVTCLIGNEVQFVAASHLTVFQVSDKTRTTMTLTVHRDELVTEPLAGAIVSQNSVTAAELSVSTQRAVAEQVERNVEIPGEYLRRELGTYGADTNSQLPAAPSRMRLIWFVTNRKESEPVQAAHRFGSELDDNVSYGTAMVSIPVRHARGKLEMPSGWWGTRQDYFQVEAVNTLESGQFLEGLIRPQSADDLLLFIHGYNVTFEQSLLRAAQLAYDTEFTGPVIVFDWASAGSTRQYPADEQRAARSTPSLANLLASLDGQLTRGDANGQLHVIAHSMGNRLLLPALSNQPARLNSLGHLVLAAPDLSHQDFIAYQDDLAAAGKSRALYYSARDKALIASRAFHVAPRLGQGPLYGARGLDNIDAMKIDTSFLSHGYYGDASLMLIDLQLLLNQDLAPPQRVTLKESVAERKYKYWYFP